MDQNCSMTVFFVRVYANGNGEIILLREKGPFFFDKRFPIFILHTKLFLFLGLTVLQLQSGNFRNSEMKVVIQRVRQAAVTIENSDRRFIEKGMVVLLGIEEVDGEEDVEWLVNKIINLRIFDDQAGVMNRSLLDIQGEAMVVSQFTLHARVKKGNRPSYVDAARPEVAIPLYRSFIRLFGLLLDRPVATGEFGADMAVELINDGPVTIIIDSRNRR
jgi:D-tyrosyl-tRNA(Tyr) deacylase